MTIEKPNFPAQGDPDNCFKYLASVGLTEEVLANCCVKKAEVTGLSADMQSVTVLYNDVEYQNVPVWIHTDCGARAALVSEEEAVSPSEYFKDAALMFPFPRGTKVGVGNTPVLPPEVLCVVRTTSEETQVLGVVHILQNILHGPEDLPIAHRTYRPFIKSVTAVIDPPYVYTKYHLHDVFLNAPASIPTYDEFGVPCLPFIEALNLDSDTGINYFLASSLIQVSANVDVSNFQAVGDVGFPGFSGGATPGWTTVTWGETYVGNNGYGYAHIIPPIDYSVSVLSSTIAGGLSAMGGILQYTNTYNALANNSANFSVELLAYNEQVDVSVVKSISSSGGAWLDNCTFTDSITMSGLSINISWSHSIFWESYATTGRIFVFTSNISFNTYENFFCNPVAYGQVKIIKVIPPNIVDPIVDYPIEYAGFSSSTKGLKQGDVLPVGYLRDILIQQFDEHWTRFDDYANDGYCEMVLFGLSFVPYDPRIAMLEQ